MTTDKTLCAARDTCSFDRRCEGFINCTEVDPLAYDLERLSVYVLDGAMHCNMPDCDCGHTDDFVIPLPGRRVNVREIVEAVREHMGKYPPKD